MVGYVIIPDSEGGTIVHIALAGYLGLFEHWYRAGLRCRGKDV